MVDTKKELEDTKTKILDMHENVEETFEGFEGIVKSLWDEMKDGYKKENPDVTLMGDKFINSGKKKLVIPKYLTEDESVILPLPKPKDD